jgi:alkylation response protein AidB-like acyl-CoA dehydrogenase
MDFRFDDEQLALRDTVRTFCTDHAGLGDIGARPPDAPAHLWNGLAELGVFGLLVPVERGGSGGGAVDAAIVFEQLGAHLVTGPLLWSTIAAPLVPEAVAGSVRVAGVVAGVSAIEPVVIEHAASCDVVVVVHDDRVERCSAAAPADAIVGEPLDPLTPAGAYSAMPAGEVIGGREDAKRMRLTGTVLASAMLVGIAQGALDTAAAYALERRQFGVPIGSFQAIKHLLADAYVRTELARSAAYAAAAIADDPRAGDPANAASAAKLLAGEAGIANARTAVQVLGGMGFTWEMLPHYFLKRAWVLEESFGTADAHALELSDALAAEVTG